MKAVRLIALLTVAAACMAQAESNVVSSANIVGYVQIQLIPGVRMLAACNFSQGSSNTLVSIFGTNQLSQSGTVSQCDKITLWDVSTLSYQTYVQWTDGKFYKGGSQNEFNSSPIVNPEIKPGVGFWIERASAKATTNTITLSGDVIEAAQTKAILTGLQILAYQFSSDIKLNEMDFSADGATGSATYANADKISVFENGRYQTYALYTDGKWYKANDATEWNSAPLATNTLAIGQGFWYNAKGSFTWDETNKYNVAFE